MQSAYCSLTGEFVQKQTAEQINYPKLKYVQNKPLTPPQIRVYKQKSAHLKRCQGARPVHVFTGGECTFTRECATTGLNQ